MVHRSDGSGTTYIFSNYLSSATSYPISGYSWALVYTRQLNQARGQARVITHTGQAYAAANGYVPLPAEIQQLARTMLRQITGPTGTHLLP